MYIYYLQLFKLHFLRFAEEIYRNRATAERAWGKIRKLIQFQNKWITNKWHDNDNYDNLK